MSIIKKLQLTTETLAHLGAKSGIKTGLLPNSVDVCVLPPPHHTMAKSCVFPK